MSIKKFNELDFKDIDDFAFFKKQEEINFPTLFLLKITLSTSGINEIYTLEKYMHTILRLFKLSEVNLSYQIYFIESIFRLNNIIKQPFHHKEPKCI